MHSEWPTLHRHDPNRICDLERLELHENCTMSKVDDTFTFQIVFRWNSWPADIGTRDLFAVQRLTKLGATMPSHETKPWHADSGMGVAGKSAVPLLYLQTAPQTVIHYTNTCRGGLTSETQERQM